MRGLQLGPQNSEETPITSLIRILFVDDDEDLRGALSAQLLMTEEFDVFDAGDGQQAMRHARGGQYDLVILDVDLPDIDGRELCRLMRKQGVNCPIVMLTGHDSDSDTILGLDAGADDYVPKPFSFPVLLARIRAHLRHDQESKETEFHVGPYSFEPSRRILTTDDDQEIRLTKTEADILKFLYRAAARPAARDVLLGEVWGYGAGVSTHTLETHIYRLRQKIELDPSNPRLLVTDAGGYRLIA